jgi:hypothetical protein
MSTITQRRLLSCLAILSLSALGFSVEARRITAAQKRAQLFDKVISGRASATAQRHVLSRGTAAIKRIVKNPVRASNADKAAVGMLSPVQRAKLLGKLGGFKVEKVTFAGRGSRRVSKLRLHLKDDSKQREIVKVVMGQNTMGYIPGSGHSYGLWKGKVVNMWSRANASSFRNGSKPIMPIWMTDGEAKRFDTIVKLTQRHGNRAVQGESMDYGRPRPWPLAKLTQRCTGNSCTTAYTRPPVGERKASYAWIDQLQNKVAQSRSRKVKRLVGSKQLLDALDGKSTSATESLFAGLKKAMPGEAAKLDTLKQWVVLHKEKLPKFPLDMMHRTSLGELADIRGDQPGPTGTKKAIRASTSKRLGVEIKPEVERNRWGYGY